MLHREHRHVVALDHHLDANVVGTGTMGKATLGQSRSPDVWPAG
jgi:hypothetical protein